MFPSRHFVSTTTQPKGWLVCSITINGSVSAPVLGMCLLSAFSGRNSFLHRLNAGVFISTGNYFFYVYISIVSHLLLDYE